MAVKISYFVHGTTTDNEEGRATGQAPGQLSELGVKQAKELPEQIEDKSFNVVFCSDLGRAVRSAKLGFEGEKEIIQDERLRECDYGDLTQEKKNWKISEFISKPYPEGESYKDVEKRMADFVDYLKKNYDGQHVAILAHQAPQLALEVLLNGKTWEQAIQEDWRKSDNWQPGWEYIIE